MRGGFGMKKGSFAGIVAGITCCLAVAGWAAGEAPASAAAVKTGAGLSEHVLTASRQGWKYQYGAYGQLIGGVRRTDCSGLIKSYLWWTGPKTNPNPRLMSVAGSSTGMLQSASVKGNINLSKTSSLPRVQGLILYSPGHVGVYVGGNVAVDNRCTGQNIKVQPVFGGRYRWQKWFKLPQLRYPGTGFVTCNGGQYYYENGQYVAGTTKSVGGTVYKFDASGRLTSGSVPASARAASAAAGVYRRVLQVGLRGSDVLALQRKLTGLHFMTADNCTGYYGPITKAAVLNYQRKKGLSATGIADLKTLSSLGL